MTRNIIITVADEHTSDIECIVKRLTGIGVQVDSVMDALGIISASTDLDNSVIQQVPGIVAVEDQNHFQLPRPDDPIQ